MKAHSILILDDDPAILMALKETLKAEGYDCFATMHVAEALSEIKKTTFAVALSDQRMAEMAGTQFLQKIKEDQPHCIRVLLTGVLTNETFLEAINLAEVFRCLPKPWTRDALLDVVCESYQQFEKMMAYPKAHQAILQINQQLVEENAQLRQQISST